MSLPVVTEQVVFNANLLQVFNSIFIFCSSTTNGGGIFSDIDAKQYIKYCTFVNCTTVNRGGAFLLKQGDVKVISCCALYCTAEICPDMICLTPNNTYTSLLQCFKSQTYSGHLMFLRAKSNLTVKNINSTNCVSNTNQIYGGITLSCGEEYFSAKFLNVVECSIAGTICYELINNREVSTYFYNAINNTNYNCLVSFLSMSESTVKLFNSIFLKNNPTMFIRYAYSSNINLFFANCTFSFEQKSEASVTITSCIFGVSNYIIPLNRVNCYYNAEATQSQTCQGMIKLSFILTTISSH
jgi:uncharacterized protein (DUF1330 family)